VILASTIAENGWENLEKTMMDIVDLPMGQNVAPVKVQADKAISLLRKP